MSTTPAPAENNALEPEEAEVAHALLRGVVQGHRLSYEEAYAVFTALSAGTFSEVETAALLAGLHARGEEAAEVAGAAAAFRAAARPFPETDVPLFDIVGTGGDGVGTINISTGAGIVAASMGLAVAKHGNRAVSSRTGAADVIAELGLPLDLSPEQAAEVLARDGFTFLFAQAYHPAMRFVAPVRGVLRTPTVFNVLGPLINPAHLSYQVMGVADVTKLDMIASCLHALGREHALVINGLGLDEITVHGTTTVREVSPEGVRSFEVTPEDLGVRTHELSEMLGGEPADNASILREVFAGGGQAGHRDAIAVNAGALLYLAGRVATLREGTEAALEQLASGKVAQHLESMTRGVAAPADAETTQEA
ncbi:anthranilate phosphoribosyltransferase [Actinomyces faecalis]|uniref:anthranilate phosphoribosyltransferase n=1 Tax=Actinomyces faecalis TaxID=2722820 RepID=UPI001556E60B|nr:anthranilate phosphoribosyltransferase [Actinomyces faecalis]